MREQEKTDRYFERARKGLRVGATVAGIGGAGLVGYGTYALEHTISGASTRKIEEKKIVIGGIELGLGIGLLATSGVAFAVVHRKRNSKR
jgi:hypothetical protein